MKSTNNKTEYAKKSIKIKDDVHEALTKFCKEHDYIIQRFVEKIILNACSDNKENNK